MKTTKKLMTLLLALLALAACQDEPNSAIETIKVNGVSFKMVKVKGGSLTLNMELPITPQFILYRDSTLNVTVRDFSIGQTEVTQALWQAVMGSNHSYFSSNNDNHNENDERVFEDDLNRPVEWVSWNDCQDFISKLNELTGHHFRIPTEAEWEFAARGGNKTHCYPYAGSENIEEVAWCAENSNNMTHPVGQKMPNELGLFDMTGNVREWCSDFEGFRSADGTRYDFRIVRGGSYYWEYFVWYRDRATQTVRSSDIGLRLAE